MPKLREAICADSKKRRGGIEHTPAEVVVSVGAKHTLFNLAAVLFEAGDEVIIPAPYWVSYPEQVRIFGAEPVVVETTEDDNEFLDRLWWQNSIPALPGAKALASMTAGAAFRIGFGLGPLFAGIVAQYWGNPLHRPFEVHVVLMVVGLACVLIARETVPKRPYKFEMRVGIPKGQGIGFAGFIGPAAFTMSFMEGTVLSLVPLFLYNTLGATNVAIAGLCGFLVLGLGGMTPIVTRHIEPRKAVMIGVSVSAVVTWLIAGAAFVGSASLVVVAAGLMGFVNGMILQGGTVICGTIVPLEERGKLMSALYMCAYAGTIPTVGLGYLSQAVGLTNALIVFSCIACVFAAWIVLFGRRLFPRVIPYVEPITLGSPTS
jgi:MFS family permease